MGPPHVEYYSLQVLIYYVLDGRILSEAFHESQMEASSKERQTHGEQ